MVNIHNSVVTIVATSVSGKAVGKKVCAITLLNSMHDIELARMAHFDCARVNSVTVHLLTISVMSKCLPLYTISILLLLSKSIA